MNFIQSFWSKPIFDIEHRNSWNFRHDGGFPNAFLFYSAWVYSCLSIKRYYPNLQLVTDDYGMAIFRDALRLPYVKFSNALNDLNDYHKGAWALGKLYTYQLQKEPFCHIDGDVFLFGPVLDKILKAPVFAQSFDLDMKVYSEIHPYVNENFRKVPDEFQLEELKGPRQLKLINAGVIGGNELEVFQRYTSRAFELVDNNQDKIGGINGGIFNLYYEQFLLSNIVYRYNVDLVTLYEEADSEIDFAAFHKIPHDAAYVHLLSHLKLSTAFLEQVVARLQLEFPEYYHRLLQFSNEHSLV